MLSLSLLLAFSPSPFPRLLPLAPFLSAFIAFFFLLPTFAFHFPFSVSDFHRAVFRFIYSFRSAAFQRGGKGFSLGWQLAFSGVLSASTLTYRLNHYAHLHSPSRVAVPPVASRVPSCVQRHLITCVGSDENDLIVSVTNWQSWLRHRAVGRSEFEEKVVSFIRRTR